MWNLIGWRWLKPVLDSDRQTAHSITCQVFSESVCPLLNSLQWSLLSWHIRVQWKCYIILKQSFILVAMLTNTTVAPLSYFKKLLVNVCRVFVMSHTCCKLANTEIVMISTLTFFVMASLRWDKWAKWMDIINTWQHMASVHISVWSKQYWKTLDTRSWNSSI